MQVAVEALGASRRQMITVVPAPQVSAAFEAALRKLGAKVKVPGFRPGKVPRQMLERRYAGYLREEVIEAVLPSHLRAALAQAGAQPLEQPTLAEVGDVRPGEGLELRFLYEEMPHFELRGVEPTELEVTEVFVDDEDIEAELTARAEAQATTAPCEEPAALGDSVTMQLTLTTADGLSESEYQTGTLGDAQAYWTPLALGRRGGEAIDGSIEVPEGQAGAVGGHLAQASGTIHAVSRRVVPNRAALAAALGHADDAAMVQAIRTDLEQQAATANQQRREGAALGHVIAASGIELPEALVRHATSAHIAGLFGSEPSDSPKFRKVVDLLAQMVRPQVVEGLQHTLLAERLVTTLGIEVSDDEVKAAAAAAAARAQGPAGADEAGEPGETPSDEEARLRHTVASEKATAALVAQMSFVIRDRVPWRERAKRSAPPAHGQAAHVHGPDCDHDHDHDDHVGHAHGHDHDDETGGSSTAALVGA